MVAGDAARLARTYKRRAGRPSRHHPDVGRRDPGGRPVPGPAPSPGHRRTGGCRRLPFGQDERQRAASAVSGKVDFAGQPTPGAPEQGDFQSQPTPAPHTSPPVTAGVVVSVLSLGVAPFFPGSLAVAAFSRASRTSGVRCMPAAS